jgi:hypothetical protein
MQGPEFMKERVKIETLYEKVDSLIKNKKIKDAKINLEKSQKLLSKLADDISGNEIQERSVFNMEIKGNYLLKKVNSMIS